MDIVKNWNKFNEYQTRCDNDYNIYILESYVLKGEGGNKLPHSTSITLNTPMVFGDAYLAIMGADKRTCEVTGIDKSRQPKIEELVDLWDYNNDENLALKLMESLSFHADWFAGFRGWIGGLPLMYRDGDKFLPTIMPSDPRWMTWKIGDRGITQFSYRIRMDKEEYGEKFDKAVENIPDTVLIENIWDMKNIYCLEVPTDGSAGVLLANKDGKTEIPHGLEFCPGVIIPVPTQPSLISGKSDYSTSFSRQGESIYAPVRQTIKDKNEWASILASLNKQQFLAPMVYTGPRKEFKETPFGWGTLIMLEPNETLKDLRTTVVSQGTQVLYQELKSEYDIATFSSVNYGVAGERQSALAIADLKSDRDKVISSRRKAKAKFFRACYSNLARQLRTGKCYHTEIDPEDAIEIDKGLFKDKFQITFSFDSVSPQENIVNAQLMGQLRNEGLPDSWLYRNIGRFQDPEGLLREAKLQRLYSILPTLELADAAIGLAPGEVTEEKINQMKARLIVKALEEQLSQAQELQKASNPASQSASEITMGRPSSEKLAAMQAKRKGAEAMTTARRSKNFEVGENV